MKQFAQIDRSKDHGKYVRRSGIRLSHDQEASTSIGILEESAEHRASAERDPRDADGRVANPIGLAEFVCTAQE